MNLHLWYINEWKDNWKIYFGIGLHTVCAKHSGK